MPKKGGKRSKQRTSAGPSKGIRLCEEDGEQYGVVTKMLGGPNCRVTCQDGTERMCVIRSKFRWRNKNHNRLSVGTWVMVGVREWETTASGEQRCDLLEVYSDGDASKLEASGGGDLGRLRRVAGAARPGSEGVGTHTGAATDAQVVFADETAADVDMRALRQQASEAVTFGAGDGVEIDLNEI